jgi:hypothetical protein
MAKARCIREKMRGMGYKGVIVAAGRIQSSGRNRTAAKPVVGAIPMVMNVSGFYSFTLTTI